MKTAIKLFLRLVVILLLASIVTMWVENTRLDEAAKEPQTTQEKMKYVRERQGLGNHVLEDYIVISKPMPLKGISAKQIFLLNTKTQEVASVFTDKEYPMGSKVKLQYYHVMINYPIRNVTAYPIIVP